MGAPEVKPLFSDEHFSVDGTLLKARASHVSLEWIDGHDDPAPPLPGVNYIGGRVSCIITCILVQID